jgi:hypothetical protein
MAGMLIKNNKTRFNKTDIFGEFVIGGPGSSISEVCPCQALSSKHWFDGAAGIS